MEIDAAGHRSPPVTVPGMLARLAQGREAAACLSCPDGAEVSYGALLGHADRYAAALLGLGLRPGDRIALRLGKRPEVLFLSLGCARAGLVQVPLNTAYTAREIAYFMQDAEPRGVVCEQDDEVLPGTVTGDALLLHPDGAAERALDRMAAVADTGRLDREPVPDIAAILYTSGTTGRPKGAMITHRNLVESARHLAGVWRLGPSDAALHALPVFHAHGLFTAVNPVLFGGGQLVFLPAFTTEGVLSALPRCTVMMGIPTIYNRLLEHPGLDRDACARMRLFISGSAPLPEPLAAAFAERTGHRLLERYGTTEAAIITANPPGAEVEPGVVGPPLPGVEIRIVDEAGKPLPAGEVGALETRGHNVFRGYWRNDAETARAIRPDGFFVTGDLACIGPDGYVRLKGRVSEMIISGGYNVYPVEVENELCAVEGIAEAAVFGVPHPDFGEAVCAAVVAPGAPLDEAAVIARLKLTLAGYKVPKRIFQVEAIPRNAMGKISKATLAGSYRDAFTDGGAAGGSSARPR